MKNEIGEMKSGINFLKPGATGLHCDILESKSYGRDPLSTLPDGIAAVVVVRHQDIPGFYTEYADPTQTGVASFEGGPVDPTHRHPAVVLIRRAIGGRDRIHAVPVADFCARRWMMFGGRYITGDSRLRDVVGYPIPLHDRFEPPARD